MGGTYAARQQAKVSKWFRTWVRQRLVQSLVTL